MSRNLSKSVVYLFPEYWTEESGNITQKEEQLVFLENVCKAKRSYKNMVMLLSIDNSCSFASASSPCFLSQSFPAVLQILLLVRYFLTLQNWPLTEAEPIFDHLKKFNSVSVLEETWWAEKILIFSTSLNSV